GVLGGARRHQDSARGGGGEPARTDAPARRAQVTRRQRSDQRAGLLFLAPALAVLGCVTVYPAVWVFWLSLQYRVPIFGIARFAGLDHYAFLATDERFLGALRVTLV